MKIAFAPLAAMLALAACSSQPTAGGLTADEERELDNAAAMLDQPNLFATSPDDAAVGEEDSLAQDNGVAANSTNRSGNAQ